MLVFSKYTELQKTLKNFENSLFNSWNSAIKDESEKNLLKPLLMKEGNGFLRVNFDPKVVALLREVRYMSALQVDAPEAAANIYSKSDVFRGYIFQLDHISGMYNGILTGVLDVERPLIQEKIKKIDQEIERALTTLNWKSEGIAEYINAVSASVGGISNVLKSAKNNVIQIQKTMAVWAASPLIERKDGKKMLNLEEKQQKLTTVFESMRKDGEFIHGVVEQTKQLLELPKSTEESPDWCCYLEYIDGLVKNGFRNMIKASLDYLVENTKPDKTSETNPLLEAKLELDNELLVFTPGMEEDVESCLMYIVHELLEDI